MRAAATLRPERGGLQLDPFVWGLRRGGTRQEQAFSDELPLPLWCAAYFWSAVRWGLPERVTVCVVPCFTCVHCEKLVCSLAYVGEGQLLGEVATFSCSHTLACKPLWLSLAASRLAATKACLPV